MPRFWEKYCQIPKTHPPIPETPWNNGRTYKDDVKCTSMYRVKYNITDLVTYLKKRLELKHQN